MIFGQRLPYDTFKSLINSKRLYDYKISYEPLQLLLGPDDTTHTRQVNKDDITNPNDYAMISEIDMEYHVANGHVGNFFTPIKHLIDNSVALGKTLSSSYTITDSTINTLSKIFDNSQIVTVNVKHVFSWHDINAYALQKMDNYGNRYKLYVYDNNFPYNPYYIRDVQNGNTYILLKRNSKGTYDFEYAPQGLGAKKYLWTSEKACTYIEFVQDLQPIQ